MLPLTLLCRAEEINPSVDGHGPVDEHPVAQELTEKQLQGIAAARSEAYVLVPRSFQALLSPRMSADSFGAPTIDATIYDRLMYVQTKTRLLSL